MQFNPDDLGTLAARTGRGDSAAAARLRSELEPQMVRIVRRTLRTRAGSTPVAQQIIVKARQLAPHVRNWETEEQEHLIRQIAVQICQGVIDRLRPDRPAAGLAETVRA